MTGATAHLYELMMNDKKIEYYIRDGWNALYNDIMDNKERWEFLDSISSMAIVDLYEREVA